MAFSRGTLVVIHDGVPWEIAIVGTTRRRSTTQIAAKVIRRAAGGTDVLEVQGVTPIRRIHLRGREGIPVGKFWMENININAKDYPNRTQRSTFASAQGSRHFFCERARISASVDGLCG